MLSQSLAMHLTPKSAAEFINFIFSPAGQEILSRNYQPVIQPPQADYPQNFPAELSGLIH